MVEHYWETSHFKARPHRGYLGKRRLVALLADRLRDAAGRTLPAETQLPAKGGPGRAQQALDRLQARAPDASWIERRN